MVRLPMGTQRMKMASFRGMRELGGVWLRDCGIPLAMARNHAMKHLGSAKLPYSVSSSR